MERIIAVDPGKFAIKAATSGDPNVLTLRSKLYSLNDNESFEPQGNSVYITYEGKNYIIGDQGNAVDQSFSKNTILHKIGVMAALSKFVKDGDAVRLILGCPASVYKDKAARNQYRDAMTDNGNLKFETNTDQYDISIVNTLVLPESSGAPYVYPQYFKDSRVAVVDIGGLNMNFSVYNNLVLELDSMRTVNYGGYMIEDMVKDKFSGRFGVALQQADYEQVLINDGLFKNGTILPESTELLHELLHEFAADISKVVKSFDYDLSLMKVLFIGGSSALLKNDIAEFIPHAMIRNDCAHVNVLGFLKVGELKSQAKQAQKSQVVQPSQALEQTQQAVPVQPVAPVQQAVTQPVEGGAQ